MQEDAVLGAASLAWRSGSEEKISDTFGKVAWIQVGAIAEDNDRKAIASEALNAGTETNRFAVMPHPLVTFIGIQKPAKPVGGWLVVRADRTTARDGYRRQCGLHFFGAEKHVTGECVVPFC